MFAHRAAGRKRRGKLTRASSGPRERLCDGLGEFQQFQQAPRVVQLWRNAFVREAQVLWRLRAVCICEEAS
jgi:hypothetical protein